MAFLLPPIGLYVPRAMVILAPLLVTALLFDTRRREAGAWRASARQLCRHPLVRSWPVLALAGAILWSALSWMWALDMWTAAKATGKLAFFAASGVLGVVVAGSLPAASRRLIANGLLAGLVVALFLLAMELAASGVISRLLYDMNSSDFERYRMSRGITVLALCAGPAVFWLWLQERAWTAALLVLGCFLLFRQMDNLSATYGFLGSCLLFPVIRWRPPWAAWMISGLCLFGVVTMPLVARNLQPLIELEVPASHYSSLYEGLRTRFRIWDFVGERIAENPVLGWGMNSSRIIPGGGVSTPSPLGAATMGTNVLPLHPHNMVLQWWLELGAVGAFVFGGFIAFTALRLARGTAGRDAAAAGIAVLAFVSLFGLLNYGMWQSWWLASQALVATMMAALLRSNDDTAEEGGNDVARAAHGRPPS